MALFIIEGSEVGEVTDKEVPRCRHCEEGGPGDGPRLAQGGGALGSEQLGQVAVELVPLIVSNLDDMESTACLCLTVLFERLSEGFWVWRFGS